MILDLKHAGYGLDPIVSEFENQLSHCFRSYTRKRRTAFSKKLHSG